MIKKIKKNNLRFVYLSYLMISKVLKRCNKCVKKIEKQVLLGQKEATARIRGALEGMDQMTLCL